jgi:hypothetical protein
MNSRFLTRVAMPYDEFDPSAIIDPRVRSLYAYWRERCADQRVPARHDIDPLDLRFILGNLLLIDVLEAPCRFRVRLHGANAARRAGYDLTGKIYDDLPPSQFHDRVLKSFAGVTEDCRPFHAFRDQVLDDRHYRYETLILPLAKDGIGVDMLLVCICYADEMVRLPAHNAA